MSVAAAWADFSVPEPGTGYGGPLRYATQAFPGFDVDEVINPEKKTPSFFFWNWPACTNAAEQFAYAQACAAEGSYRAARRGYDQLVCEWPAAPEAALAQKALADQLFYVEEDYSGAFDEYKYLLDFYASDCNYTNICHLMYQVANKMREHGKRVCFIRFENAATVRHAYESVVLHAPGAEYAPAATLAVAELRERESQDEKAVEVYENLRGMYPRAPEATTALEREAAARMRMLAKLGYNRQRCRETLDFLRMAHKELGNCEAGDLVAADIEETERLLEHEAYEAARYYDTRTRTRRNTINAYRQYLLDYPAAAHSESVRERLAELEAAEREADAEAEARRAEAAAAALLEREEREREEAAAHAEKLSEVMNGQPAEKEGE